MSYIGLNKIIVPDVPHLMFRDGMALADSAIDESLAEAVIKDRAKVAILFPDHFVQYAPESDSPKIYAEFFVGLLEGMLEKIRDEVFPDLKISANKSKIKLLNQDRDFMDCLDDIFNMPSVTYASLEDFIGGRINVGVVHMDNSYTLLPTTESEWASIKRDEQSFHLIQHIENKFYKGLHVMFARNLCVRDSYFVGPKKPDLPRIQSSGLRLVN